MKIQFTDKSGAVVTWDNVPDEKLKEILSIRHCAELLAINENTAFSRIRRGWPVLMALATEDNKQ